VALDGLILLVLASPAEIREAVHAEPSVGEECLAAEGSLDSWGASNVGRTAL